MGRVKIGLSFIRLLNTLEEEKRFITIGQLFFFVLWDIGEWGGVSAHTLIS